MELHFLYKLDKFLPTPQVIFDRDTRYSGYYLYPEKEEYQIGDKFYDCRNGIIVVTSLEGTESILLHEYRHHWQFTKGWIYDGIGWNDPIDYNQSIVDFFMNSYSEMDAFLFSYNRCKDELEESWMELLFPKFLDSFIYKENGFYGFK